MKIFTDKEKAKFIYTLDNTQCNRKMTLCLNDK